LEVRRIATLRTQKNSEITDKFKSGAEEYLFSSLTKEIIGCAIRVHKILGPGFVEKIYQGALSKELTKSNLNYIKEKKVSVKYENAIVGYQVIDFIIEGKIIVELKAVSELNNIHIGQMVSYLKATNEQVGLILNFAKSRLEIKRVKL